jgi:hypothetical protein
MSGQLSLFDIEEKKKPDDIVDVITTKKKAKKPKPKENTAEDVVEMKTAESDKYGWGTLPKHEIWKSEGIDYVDIDLFSQSDLSGIKYSAHHHYTHENPNSMLGSSWGGGGCFNPSNLCEIKEVFDEILQHKKRNLQEKYRVFTDTEQKVAYSHHYAYYDYRLVPAKNYFIVISNELLKMMGETGFDFEAWYEEYRELPENLATDDDWKFTLEKLQLMEKGDKLNDKLDRLQPILEMKDIGELPNTKQEVKELFEKYFHELKEIDDKIDEYSSELERYQKTLNKLWW